MSQCDPVSSSTYVVRINHRGELKRDGSGLCFILRWFGDRWYAAAVWVSDVP